MPGGDGNLAALLIVAGGGNSAQLIITDEYRGGWAIQGITLPLGKHRGQRGIRLVKPGARHPMQYPVCGEPLRHKLGERIILPVVVRAINDGPIILPHFLIRLPGIVHPRTSQLGHLRLKLGNLSLEFSRIAVNVGPLHQLICRILGRAERTIAQLIDVFE